MSSRQQRNRKQQIRNNAIQYFERYIGHIGLKPYSLNLQTTNGDLVHLNLSSDPVANMTTKPKSYSITKNLQLLLLKHGISQECYHELAQEFDCLPRSYKVTIYSYSYYICIHIANYLCIDTMVVAKQ